MKILLINTYDTYGGAALACKRLLQALNQQKEIKVKLLVQEKKSLDSNTFGLAVSSFQKKKAFFKFAWERFTFFLQERDKSVRFGFSPANMGVDISKHPLVLEADILHLHWVNFGFLSLKSLEGLFQLGKPIIWTLHDMWAFTGGCHYTNNCTHYHLQCGNCQFLKNPKPKDWSWQIFQRKLKLFQNTSIYWITCSEWLAKEAGKSALLQQENENLKLAHIPNPIDTNVFQAIPQREARTFFKLPQDKFLLLFGAMNTQDKRKGFAYLKAGLQILSKKHPEVLSKIELVIFGKAQLNALEDLNYKIHLLGFLSGNEALVNVYNATDVFVLPSLEDNLPNTVMESLACATPVVAFDTGGIPEMIDHCENGYLARYQSAEDLAEGIYHIFNLNEEKRRNYKQAARAKALRAFSEDVVANKYIDIYKSTIQKSS